MQNSLFPVVKKISDLGLKYPPIVSDLPSLGIIYPENHFFHQYGKVVYKKLTAQEEQLYSEPLFINNSVLLNQMCESLIYFNDSPKISIEDMIIADRDVMVLMQRIVSFGDKLYGLEFECSECDSKLSPSEIEIRDIKIEKLSLIPFEPNKNVFMTKINKHRILFKFFTVKDELESGISALYSFKPSEFLSKVIIEVDGYNDPQIIEQFVKRDLSIKDVRKLYSYISEHEPYIKFISNSIICKNCHYDNKVETRINLDFLGINHEKTKEIQLDEFYILERHLNMTYDDVLQLPIQDRKSLKLKTIANVKKENNPKEAESNEPLQRHGSKKI